MIIGHVGKCAEESDTDSIYGGYGIGKKTLKDEFTRFL